MEKEYDIDKYFAQFKGKSWADIEEEDDKKISSNSTYEHKQTKPIGNDVTQFVPTIPKFTDYGKS